MAIPNNPFAHFVKPHKYNYMDRLTSETAHLNSANAILAGIWAVLAGATIAMPNEKSVTAFIAFLCAALFVFCIFLLLRPISGSMADSPDSAKTDKENFACALKHFEKQKYKDFISFPNDDGETVSMGHKVVRDDENYFRAEGALIYPDGESSTFSVGVIYDESAWSEDTAKTVNRHHSRRNVKIKTVLAHEDIRNLAIKNDYIIPVGLASNEDSNESDKNLRLAFARAYNLGLAVHELGWLPIERIWPSTLGYAREEAVTKSQELKQRPVMLIGVNARRPVKVPEYTFSALKIAPQDRIIAEEYIFAGDRPKQTRDLDPKSGYLEYTNISLMHDDSEYSPLILPAVPQSIDEDIGCTTLASQE